MEGRLKLCPKFVNTAQLSFPHVFFLVLSPNSRFQPLPEAGATQERTREAVGWKPVLDLPSAPVARSPPMMCHCDDFDCSVADPVHKTEREVREEIAASVVQITRLTMRGFLYPFHTGVDLGHEGTGGYWTPLRVPLRSSVNFRGCRRMKFNRYVRHPYSS